MANIFPQLSSGSAYVLGDLLDESLMKYPVTQSHSYVTRVIRFLGDQEQAWIVRRSLFYGAVQYHQINGYDLARVRDFFSQMKGMYLDDALLNTFSFTIKGVTYNYCVFDQDKIEVTESNQSGNFDFSIKVKQVRPN